MNQEELIAEARAHLERAADAAPKSARRAIKAGEAEDQRLSLVARLASALEQAHTPTEAHVKPFDTSPEPVKNGADSLHVTPTDAERARVEQSNEVAGIVFDQVKRVWPDLHPVLDLRYGIADALWDAGFRRTVQGEQMTGKIHAVAFEDGGPDEYDCGLEDCECPDHEGAPRAAGTYLTIRLNDGFDSAGPWRVEIRRVPVNENGETP